VHAVCPNALWYLPASQALHTPSPSADVTVPGPHGVWLVAPVGHAEPAGHAAQSLCAVAPVEARKLPLSHSKKAEEPRSQYEPSGQALHAVSPAASWYDPATHGSHSAFTAIDALVNDPFEHGVCFAAPAAHEKPASHGLQIDCKSASW
jgi:hypothetical protein